MSHGVTSLAISRELSDLSGWGTAPGGGLSAEAAYLPSPQGGFKEFAAPTNLLRDEFDPDTMVPAFGIVYLTCFYMDWAPFRYYPDARTFHLKITPQAGPAILWYGWVTAAAFVSDTRSASVVGGDTTADPWAASTTSCARRSSPGPHRTTEIRRCRSRSCAAIAANRDGGHRLFGHAAPGLSSA